MFITPALSGTVLGPGRRHRLKEIIIPDPMGLSSGGEISGLRPIGPQAEIIILIGTEESLN